MATNLRQGLGKRGILTALLVLVIGAGLAACGEATPAAVTEPTATTAAAAGDVVTTQPTEAPASADTGDMQEVKLVLTEWAIEPSTVEVPAGKVRFSVTNEGKFSHNATIKIEGQGDLARTTNFKSDDGIQTLEVDLQPGTYQLICDITGHPEQGMTGTLIVK